MKRSLPSWILLTAFAAGAFGIANVAWTATCPSAIYLANNATTADHLQSNGGFPEFDLLTSQPTGNGMTCIYSRPADPNYDAFIFRELNANEISATLFGDDAWHVSTTDGKVKTVTCPTSISLGPVAWYALSGGGMQQLPANWLVTQNGVQALTFDNVTSSSDFPMRCNYKGFSNVSVYIPPPTRIFSRVVCSGLYTAGLPLSARLARCPGLDDLLLWEDGAGNVFSHSGYSYPSWTAQQKTRLDQLFSAIQTGQSDLKLDCPDPAANIWTYSQTNDAAGNPVHSQTPIQLFFTANQAFDTYTAHVAWILYVEVNHLVPWSLFDHPASELAEFFDSRRYHTRFPPQSAVNNSVYANPQDYPTNIQAGRDFWNATTRRNAAWEAVCDPRIGYQFLSGKKSSSQANLIGATEIATLKNITWWFHNNVAHGDFQDVATSALLSTPSIYLSNRLRARIDTHSQPPSQPLVFANEGCHSAANLFYDLAKSVNIPLLHVASLEPPHFATYPFPQVHIALAPHSGLVYGWVNRANTLILQHTDDIYAQYNLIFPIDAAGRPVSDPAQTLFSATWLTPAQLSTWGYQVTGDYSLQDAFSTYGVPMEHEVESQGILAGYWIPTPPPNLANSIRFVWFLEGQLCSCGGAHNVMAACNENPSLLQGAWLSTFGQTVLQAPNSSTSTSAQDYLSHLQACAEAYTGISSPANACQQMASCGSGIVNRTATNYWVGPLGK